MSRPLGIADRVSMEVVRPVWVVVVSTVVVVPSTSTTVAASPAILKVTGWVWFTRTEMFWVIFWKPPLVTSTVQAPGFRRPMRKLPSVPVM